MWVRILICVIVFLSGCQLSSHDLEATLKEHPAAAPSEQESDRNHQDGNEPIQYPSDSHIRVEDIESAIKNLVEPDSGNEKKEKIGREKDDLKAQQRMAYYTKLLFIASAFAVLLTGVGLELLRRTLVATQNAADSTALALKQAIMTTEETRRGIDTASQNARQQLVQAQRANEVSRDMGVAQTRAYISIQRVAIWVQVLKTGGLGWQSNNRGNFHFTIKPIFENTGNTPAYNVSYKFKISLLENNKHLLRSGFGQSSSFGVIGHKSNTSKGPVYMVSNDVPKGNISGPIEAKGIRCWLIVRAEYSDVFDNRWYVESIFEGNPDEATGKAGNVKDLVLSHQTASDKHGKIKTV